MSGHERGAAAVLTAAVFVFLVGAAALAVDVSMFQSSARAGQRTADLSCLAGIAEAAPLDAVDTAAAFARQNWSAMEGRPVTYLDATTGLMSNGGHTIVFDAAHGGDPDVMRVIVSESNDTNFAALYTSDVDVVQEAVCGRRPSVDGPGSLPFGSLTGTFSGDLFDCTAKVTGNCGAVRIDGSGSDVFRESLTDGAGNDTQKHHGPSSGLDPDNGAPFATCPSSGPCTVIETETGNMVGPFLQGLTTRLSDVSGADCALLGTFNCDSMTDVLGGVAATLDSEFGGSEGDIPADFPSEHAEVQGWEPSLYGPYAAAKDGQYFYDGSGIKCDSPRLVSVPIVVNAGPAHKGGNAHWDLGDPGTTYPNGNGSLKIVGFYTGYLREPSDPTELATVSGLGQVVVDVVWFGPNATCDDGSPFSPLGVAEFTDGVRLTAG